MSDDFELIIHGHGDGISTDESIDHGTGSGISTEEGQNITKGNIDNKIKETRILVDSCRNPVILRRLKSDLTCYLAIKNLFDKSEKEN